jgi:hypothetical protein
MSIFLAAQNNGPVIGRFKEKGCGNLMPGQVSDCPIVVTNKYVIGGLTGFSIDIRIAN